MAGEEERRVAVFSDLLAANRSRLFGYIYAMLHNMSDAEDLYQQTTVLLWEKFGEFEPGTDFGSWALKFAYYNTKNFQRSQGRSRVFFSEAVMEKVAASYGSAQQADSSDQLKALANCLSQMSDTNQQLLRLRYSENTSVKRLSEIERKTEAAMSMVLTRLRKSLLRCVTKHLALYEAR